MSWLFAGRTPNSRLRKLDNRQSIIKGGDVGLTVRPVQSRRDLKTFIHMPYKLYQDESNWVPPLRVEEKKKFSVKTNPYLEHCDYLLFLLLRNGKAVGRISAFVDHLALEHWREQIGFFGCFETINDVEGTRLLINAARDWLKDRGMATMRGPWSFSPQEWGMLVEGFDTPPMVMAPHNFPYYDSLLTSCGLLKAKDLLVFEMDASEGYQLPDRFVRWSDRIAEKLGVTIRPLNLKRLEEDVRLILSVANQSTEKNWGFIPVTDKEASDIAKALKAIVDPDIILIAEKDGEAVGYLIAFPNVNALIRDCNGRLFTKAIFRLLFKMKSIREYRVWALGVVPAYQRKALDTLFYRRLADVLAPRRPSRVEANYVLEDNMVMNNPILKLGFHQSKRLRVYEAPI